MRPLGLLLGYLCAALLSVTVVSCGSVDEKNGADGGAIAQVGFAEEVRNTADLQLARITVTKTGTIDDLKAADAHTAGERARVLLNTIKVGKRIGVYSFNTYVSAYLDMRQMGAGDIRIDSAAHTCRVVLPPVSVRIDGRDSGIVEEHYRVTGLRSDITPEERALLKEQMSRLLEKEVMADSRLLERLRLTAENKARLFIQNLALKHGLTATVEFNGQ